MMKQFQSNEAVCECRYQVNCSMGNEDVERNIFRLCLFGIRTMETTSSTSRSFLGRLIPFLSHCDLTQSHRDWISSDLLEAKFLLLRVEDRYNKEGRCKGV
jgi:hypothetical protein